MADQKISALTAASSVDPDDLLVAVDVSDTTMNASGTNKKATREIIQTYNAGTLTSDKKLLDLSGTWNAAGTTFTGLKLNVTDTASASGSLLLDLQKGGTSQLALNKNGALVATGTGRFGDGFRVEGTGTGLTGTGIGAELFVAGSVAYISSYNRTTSAYSALSFYGSTIEFIAGSERQKFGGSSVVFNDPGNDYDFRIEGDTDANLLFVDASTDRVGIGTNAPAAKLSVVGELNVGNSVNNSATNNFLRLSGRGVSDGANFYGSYGQLLLNASTGYTADARRYLITNAYNANSFAIIRSVDSSTDPALGTGGVISSGTADLVLSNTGNLGLGATSTTGYWPANLTQTSARAAIYYDDSTTNLNNANAGLVIVNSNSAANTSSKLVFGAYNADPVPVGLAYISATNSSRVSAYLSGSLIFGTAAGGGSGATERMRLDSSGNLGLGVTPSAWSSAFYVAIEGGDSDNQGAVAFRTDANGVELFANAFFNGTSYVRKFTGAAGFYANRGGDHIWNTAASGSGNITWSERFKVGQSSAVINEDGNDYDFRIEGDTDANLLFVDASADAVGFGTNAPVGKVTAVRDYVNSSNANFVAVGSVPGLSLHTYVNGRFSVFTNYTAANTTSFVVGTGTNNPSVESVLIDHSTGSFTVNRAAVFNESGGDYDFRIEGDTDANLVFVDASTDRVGIGFNNPGEKFDVSGNIRAYNGDFVFSHTAKRLKWDVSGAFFSWIESAGVAGDNYMRFAAGNAEALRIHSSTAVLLGGTSTPANGTKCLTITTGTAPTASPADTFTIYSSDVSAGNTTLSIYTEGTPVSDSTDNAVTKKIAVRINGTLYYLLADTDNS